MPSPCSLLGCKKAAFVSYQPDPQPYCAEHREEDWSYCLEPGCFRWIPERQYSPRKCGTHGGVDYIPRHTTTPDGLYLYSPTEENGQSWYAHFIQEGRIVAGVDKTSEGAMAFLFEELFVKNALPKHVKPLTLKKWNSLQIIVR